MAILSFQTFHTEPFSLGETTGIIKTTLSKMKKSRAGSMHQVPSQALAVNCIGRSTLRWAKEKSWNLGVTVVTNAAHGQYPISKGLLVKYLSFPLTLWIRRDCLTTLTPYYPSEQLHLFAMMKTRCGVKQGLWKCWFRLQNEIKTRWGDSKNEVGLERD